MSATLTTKSLTDWTRDLLQPALPSEFRFFKSFGHFRKVFEGGVSYLGIDAVTHGRGWYHLAFYLGVRHDALERQIRDLLGLDPKLGHYDRSIRCYTVNIGPDSPHWRYAIRGSWSFAVVEELPAAASAIVPPATASSIFSLVVTAPRYAQRQRSPRRSRRRCNRPFEVPPCRPGMGCS